MENKGISTSLVLLIILGIVLVGSGVTYYYVMVKPQQKAVVCTQEAKICPNDSTVGRTGPNCEFTPCPNLNTNQTADWKTYTNQEFGFEMKYPLNGISMAKEPIISVIDCNYDNFSSQCPDYSEFGIERTSPDLTAKKINPFSTIICEYVNSEGAAGTVFSTYYYVAAENKKCLIVKLNYISHVGSCGAYGSPEEKNYKDCENDLENLFDIIDMVPFTFKFLK